MEAQTRVDISQTKPFAINPLPTAPNPLPFAQGARRYDLDWLRVIAIITLVFYHTGMIYVSWDFHIKSAEHSQSMQEVMVWLHRWRMPLLFFISGAGTFFALRKCSLGSYASERVRRLFVPLVFGMFIIVPPQIYAEWLFRGRFTGSYTDFYPEVFTFQPYQDGGKGGAFSWHHLWFVAYLFLYSLISIPIFRWLKSNTGQRFVDRIGRLIARPGGALWLVGFLLLNDIVLGGFFPNETHALVNDWAYFTKNLILFWLGYVLISRRDFWQTITDQRHYFLVATLICTAILYSFRVFVSAETYDNSRLLITLFSFNGLGVTWFSVLATVAYGYRYLNKNHRLLPYLNEAVYPFYILHQTAIILIGYYVLTRTSLGVYDGFLVISLSSFAVCTAVYLLVIRPFKLSRILFGLKV
ncbi:acyltransferase family protein [Spirosoma validum]|uniref:Acyltransferase family protein n=1 Tax=Spirosoma validum TaxID=2771355 RepID=A0A927B8J4_9BACT|nr:acyltransferase family protein [Spirosoma validum]MBD2757334.1 acyltransferase family protein [Spirosoma validum]